MDNNAEETRTLYCGNLADEVTEELLYELCLQAGPIQKISIPTHNGKRRNYGFVTYKEAVSVPYAVKLLSEEMLFKRKLVLRARGQFNESPRNSPKSDDRRYSSPEVSVIHDKRRLSSPYSHNPINNHHQQHIMNAINNGQIAYMMNRQQNAHYHSQIPQYAAAFTSPMFSPNRFPKWK